MKIISTLFLTFEILDCVSASSCGKEGTVSGGFICCSTGWVRGDTCPPKQAPVEVAPTIVQNQNQPQADQKAAPKSQKMSGFSLDKVWKIDIPNGTTVDPTTWGASFKTRMMILSALIIMLSRAGASRVEMMGAAVLGFGLIHLSWQLAISVAVAFYGYKKKKILYGLGGALCSYAFVFGKAPSDLF